jgi:hypothetical protein
VAFRACLPTLIQGTSGSFALGALSPLNHTAIFLHFYAGLPSLGVRDSGRVLPAAERVLWVLLFYTIQPIPSRDYEVLVMLATLVGPQRACTNRSGPDRPINRPLRDGTSHVSKLLAVQCMPINLCASGHFSLGRLACTD